MSEWITVETRLPEPQKPVLLDIGKQYPIRAMWLPKFTLPVGLEDDSGFGEYSETDDDWFCPEGWYEWNQHEECHWAVSEKPLAWCELPVRGTPTPAGEPVAWRYQDARGHYRYRGYAPRFDKDYAILKPIPLYTSPQPVREPLSTVELMRVVMKADEESQDTRGTTNWAAHIGKAVQAAVLAGGAQPVRRALTPERVKEIMCEAGYDCDDTPDPESDCHQ